MQSDERDVLAILEFDLREETIGIWLRCIMQRLEEKRGLRKDLPQLFIEGDEPIPSVPSVRRNHVEGCSRLCLKHLFRFRFVSRASSVNGLTSSSSRYRIRVGRSRFFSIRLP